MDFWAKIGSITLHFYAYLIPILQMAANSFAQFLKVSELTAQEIEQLKGHCYRGYTVVDGHFLYHGKDGSDYGKVTLTLRGVKFGFRRHQLALYLKMVDEGRDLSEWSGGREASHLCHKRRCFNPSHIVLEDHGINQARETCAKDRKCRGHGESPSCIF